ncbi:DNA-directed RNA polymerase I subunit RPA2 [Datura stramonium]|uniref:DNA-directed RNA polymerase I subunit RPA2 n=1 Tax=Datura stramonium TaxID=4076 RepID=A0ABS8RKW5_DATST|nr:DNA-directed RNA polymerase I subunit RPA2 [Datura stramonium]
MEEEKPKIEGNKAMSRPHLLQQKDYSALKELFSHHIESFDHMVDNGLETMLLNIKPVEVVDSFSKLKLRNILFFEGVLFLLVLFFSLVSNSFFIFLKPFAYIDEVKIHFVAAMS